MSELLAAAGIDAQRDPDAAARPESNDPEVTSVATDSRAVEAGALFACIVGAHHDGHDHAAGAVRSGAVAVLAQRPLAVDVPCVVVADVASVVGALASVVAGRPTEAIVTVGVTGTNGKTTTTYMFASIARNAGRRPALIGTTGVRYDDVLERGTHTTPDACALQRQFAQLRTIGIDCIAIEVSSHALVQRRVDGTRFAAAIFTNLSQDHLDYHGTFEAYGAAKAMLFEPRFTNVAVVNIDDAFGAELAHLAAARGLDVWTTSCGRSDADVRADHIRTDGHSTEFELSGERVGRSTGISMPFLGEFNVANAVGAAAAALAIGWDVDAVARGLQDCTQVPGRMEIVHDASDLTVIVDYAHTPDALARALATLRPVAARRGGSLSVVFGCGGDRDAAKRPEMGAQAARGADHVVVTSDNPRSEDPVAIADAIVAGIGTGDRHAVVVELDRRRAIHLALRDARHGAVVLVAGKGDEPGQTIAGVTTPFDDRAVVRQELARLGRGAAPAVGEERSCA